MGQFRPLFFIFVSTKWQFAFVKFHSQCWDSNHRSLQLEATALPTPRMKSFRIAQIWRKSKGLPNTNTNYLFMIIFFRSWWKSNKSEKKKFLRSKMIYPLKNPPPPPRTHPVHLTFVESVRRRSNKDGNVHWGAIPLGGGGVENRIPGEKLKRTPFWAERLRALTFCRWNILLRQPFSVSDLRYNCIPV